MGKGRGQAGGGKKAPTAPSSSGCLLVFVGLPGSGKSTVAARLVSLGWERVNQDDLGSADLCKKMLVKALKNNKNVILDRCNAKKKERKMFITETVRDTGVKLIEALWLDPGIEECKQRVLERRGHPNLQGERGGEVIDSFARGFAPPESFEGFQTIYTVRTNEEVEAFVKEIKVKYARAPSTGAVSSKGVKRKQKGGNGGGGKGKGKGK